jgi:hypothetical protein
MAKAGLIVGRPCAYSSSDPTTPVPAPPALQRYPAPSSLDGRIAHVRGGVGGLYRSKSNSYTSLLLLYDFWRIGFLGFA